MWKDRAERKGGLCKNRADRKGGLCKDRAEIKEGLCKDRTERKGGIELEPLSVSAQGWMGWKSNLVRKLYFIINSFIFFSFMLEWMITRPKTLI